MISFFYFYLTMDGRSLDDIFNYYCDYKLNLSTKERREFKEQVLKVLKNRQELTVEYYMTYYLLNNFWHEGCNTKDEIHRYYISNNYNFILKNLKSRNV